MPPPPFFSCASARVTVRAHLSKTEPKKWIFDAGSREERGRWVTLIKDVARKAKDIEDGSIIIKEEEYEVVYICAAVVCARLLQLLRNPLLKSLSF